MLLVTWQRSNVRNKKGESQMLKVEKFFRILSKALAWMPVFCNVRWLLKQLIFTLNVLMHHVVLVIVTKARRFGNSLSS